MFFKILINGKYFTISLIKRHRVLKYNKLALKYFLSTTVIWKKQNLKYIDTLNEFHNQYIYALKIRIIYELIKKYIKFFLVI